MARNIAVGSNLPVAFFSLEMSSVQLITRLISSETGLSSEKLRTGKLEPFEWEQLNVKVKDLEQAPIFIDDTPSLSIFDLRAKCRRLASQHGIKLIMIDYLQLMTIYRPEYYNLEEWDDDDRSPTANQAEFIVAKHRNGATDAIRMKFLGQFGKFDNLDDFSTPYEFGSKMNAANDDTLKPDALDPRSLPSAKDAFGDFPANPEDDVPF